MRSVTLCKLGEKTRREWGEAHSPLVRSRDVRSIALKTLGKERDWSQSSHKREILLSQCEVNALICSLKFQTDKRVIKDNAPQQLGSYFCEVSTLG